MINLHGLWDLRQVAGDYACPIQLPGDGISALHAAGLIPDPYFGRNEVDLRWISASDWVASRSFHCPQPDMALVLSMLDTVAEVAINGVVVHRSDSMYRSYRIDVSAALRVGANEIAITFRAAPAEALRRQQAQPYFIPFVAQNTPIPHGNMLRKPACDFGWDWNIALAPFGLYGDCHLEPLGQARLTDLVVQQAHSPGRVVVTLSAQVEGAGEVVFDLCGQRVAAPVQGGQARAAIAIDKPALWWPAGQGAQVLHDLTITFGDQLLRRRLGLRDMALITQKDAAGLGFKFAVNGREVFAKGANWIPADALPGRITPDATRALLQSAIDAHMNMIRVWGGGRYEPDWFYDLCDELGLMVWQDFMFSCHLYPADAAFLDDVAIEVRQQALRLHHHACLALWCGDNELIGALTWYPESRANRDRYLVGYDRLNRTIEAALKAAVPHALWWPSSPSPGPMDFGDAWHDDSKGDMHFWSVWHEGRDFDHYRDVAPRFCSEFGFQSYPSMDVIRRFADPADFNIAAPVMEAHQKNAGGNARIAETMFRYFRFPVDFPNFVYLSQVQQGLAIKTAVTHWRSLRPHCMGTLIWQLNDTWPTCSWSSLDHGGGWKLLHHMAREFYAPVFVSAVPVGGSIELRAVNDTGAAVELTIAAQAVNMAGQTRPLARAQVVVGGDAVCALTLAQGDLAPDEMLTYSWADRTDVLGRDHFAPRPYKTYDLRASGARLKHQVKDGLYHIEITSQNLSLFAALEADVPGRFSQNAMMILPESPVQVTFTPMASGQTPRFTLRDLHSATYG
jgi:beta-mannosidase